MQFPFINYADDSILRRKKDLEDIYIYIFLEDFFILPVYHARPARTWLGTKKFN